jgi:3-phenylpropionate/trans-cinnamate dioxygenase ferredoxin subunit
MSPKAKSFITVARAGEIPEGGVKVVRIEDQTIAVFFVGGRYYALDDVCTHDGGPLASGFVEGVEIECPRHGARFDLATGAALTLPAVSPVTTYEVKLEGDDIGIAWESYDGETPVISSAGAAKLPAMPKSAPAPGTPAAQAAAPAASAAPSIAPPPAGETPAPSQQEFAVRSALESVMDPEINLSVIDLGLIREIHFLPDQTLVKMMLTTPFCPYAPQLMADVKQATMAVVPLPCEVEILPDAWSPDLMPDPGLLGFTS